MSIGNRLSEEEEEKIEEVFAQSMQCPPRKKEEEGVYPPVFSEVVENGGIILAGVQKLRKG